MNTLTTATSVRVALKPSTHRRRRRDATVELSRVGGVYRISQLVGDSFDESEQTCQQRVELRRVGGVTHPSAVVVS